MLELSPILSALLGTSFTFFATAAGAAMVFLFKSEIKIQLHRLFLGFAAGVMIAASVWSLLIPAIEMAEELGKIGWIPAAGGFALGSLIIFLLDKLLPHLHAYSDVPEGLDSSFKRTTLLILAVTLHNLPEGLAVGIAFGMAGQPGSNVTMASAIVLAFGIGLQNFPEGAAISLPLKKEGFSNQKAFLFGTASGIVEPIAGVLGVLLVGSVVGVMPWLLALAAGAMIYVVAEELIPEANTGEHSDFGTLGVIVGFMVMMILDVALG